MEGSEAQGGSAGGLVAAFDELLVELRRALLERYGARLVSAAVFGSVARRTPNPESDVDLLVVADPLPDGRMRRVEDFEPVERTLAGKMRELARRGVSTRLSPVFRTPQEVERGGPIFLDMVEYVRILHDRGGFLQDYLTRLGHHLQSIGARRVPYKGAWYWDLGPGGQAGGGKTRG